MEIKRKQNKSSIAESEMLNNTLVTLLQDKKANEIVSLDLRQIPEAIADFYIICHGTSTTQTRAMIDYVEQEMKTQYQTNALHTEGKQNGEWCLIDFGEVIIHVFIEEKRELYQLEDLWQDAERIDYN